MTTEKVLTTLDIFKIAQQHKDDPCAFARAIEQAVLQSLPYQNSFSIRGDSYAGVYVWVGNENLVQHIPKVLAQTANDPQSMLGAVAAECIQELKRFSETQSPEVRAWKRDAERLRVVLKEAAAELDCLGSEIERIHRENPSIVATLPASNVLSMVRDAAMEQQT